MLHDEEEYPDPESFNPERFLNDDKNVSRNPADIIFGFGRRFVLVKIPTKIYISI
jgi:cytochrome P450